MVPAEEQSIFELARTAYMTKKIESFIEAHGVLPPLASTFVDAAMFHGDVSPVDIFVARRKWAHEWKSPILEQIATGQPLTYEKEVLKNLLEYGFITPAEVKIATLQGITERPIRAIEALTNKGPGLLPEQQRTAFASKLEFISDQVAIDPIKPTKGNWIEENITRYLNEGIKRGMYTQNDINNACFNSLQHQALKQVSILTTKREFTPQDLFLVDLASYMGFLE